MLLLLILLLLLLSFLQIAVQVSGYQHCWVFGDEFTNRSFEQYFKNRRSSDYNSYVKANFDVMGFSNSEFLTDNPSTVSRYSNLLINTMNVKQVNNKILIVVVPDDDLLKLFKDSTGNGLSKPFSHVLNYIMTEYDRNIWTFKEFLPAKSVRGDWPHVLWIEAPLHDNFTNNSERYKFNKCLEEVVQIHDNMSALALEKVWNPKNGNLFLENCGRFTCDGYCDYWEAADKMVRFCDSIMLKKKDQKIRKIEQKVQKFGQKGQNFDQKDRFRWQNPALNNSRQLQKTTASASDCTVRFFTMLKTF